MAIKPRHENGSRTRGALTPRAMTRRLKRPRTSSSSSSTTSPTSTTGAWSYHHLTRLELARADIESAKRLKSSGEVYLAGIIERADDRRVGAI